MASRHDYAGKPRPTIDLRPPMVLRGFGNTPVPVEMFIPPGTTPPITDVTYAGTYPLRHYLTNPPITTPSYPANPPRATNKAPVRPFAPYDRLTNTRATTAQLGSLRGHEQMHLGALSAGQYSGAVGRVIRHLDADTGAGLRGQIVGARIHGAPPMHMHGMLGGMLGRGLGLPSVPPNQLDLTVSLAIGTADQPTVYTKTGVNNYVVIKGVDRITCTYNESRKELKIKVLPVAADVEASILISYTTPAGVERHLPILILKATAAAIGNAIAETASKANDILRAAGRPSIPAIDWQDANVVRGNYEAIRKNILAARKTVYCGDGCMNQTRILLEILDAAKQNPQARTLRQVLEIYCASRGNTVEAILGGYVNEPAGWAFRRAVQAAVDAQTGEIVAAISAQVIVATVSAILGAVTMGAGAVIALTLSQTAVQMAARQFDVMDTRAMLRAFGGGIKVAVQNPNAIPAVMDATVLAMQDVRQAAAVIVAQASAGFRGTPAQEEKFRAAWNAAKSLGATTINPTITGIEPDPVFLTLMTQIRSLRPDLVGEGGGQVVLRDPNDPKWITINALKREAGLIVTAAVLFQGAKIVRRQALSPLPAATLTKLGRLYTAFKAAWPTGPNPADTNEVLAVTKTITALYSIQKLYPEALPAAGIPQQALPAGGGSDLPPPPPGGEMPPPPPEPVRIANPGGSFTPEPDTSGGGGGGGGAPSGGDAGAGPGTPGPGTPGGDAGGGAPGPGAGPGIPGGDAGGGAPGPGPGTGLDRREGGGEQKSGGIPGWAIAAGAVAIIGGGFLLLRR
jgi:hypothetical protein